MELKLQAAKEPTIDEEDVDGDREGFTIEVYRYIKKNADLSAITNMANGSLYNIRQ